MHMLKHKSTLHTSTYLVIASSIIVRLRLLLPNVGTPVPYWVNGIVNHVGRDYPAGVQCGFVPSQDNLLPVANWGYNGVPGVWDEESGESFEQADNNTIMITGNFIQYQPAQLPHPIN